MLFRNDRRRFLKSSLAGSAAIGVASAVPRVLLAASNPAPSQRNDKILVVVQLTGGNDGLNTVIPYGDDEYYKNRFTLAINKQNVLKIDDHIGLHPALRGFARLIEDRQLAIVQGVGYPNPNRSHFESMDLWHTAHQLTPTRQVGWLGKTVARHLPKQPLPAIHLGEGFQPLALKTLQKPIPSIRSIKNFRLNILREPKTRIGLTHLLQTERNAKTNQKNSLLSYVHQSSQIAIETSHRLEKIAQSPRSEFGYPGTRLGNNLATIAQLINSGLETRVYYTTLTGFDTHAKQAETHQALLRELGDSVAAFMKELKAQGNSERIVLFSFSEFGRRVRENASHGTDHGAAAPLFVCGANVRAGLVGQHPDLIDLDQGDMRYKIDYRSVYSELLRQWLDIDPAPIVGGKFPGVPLFV